MKKEEGGIKVINKGEIKGIIKCVIKGVIKDKEGRKKEEKDFW